MFRRAGILSLALAAALVLIPCRTWSASPEQGEELEVSPAAAGLIKLINTGSEQTLRKAPGLSAEVVARILAHRAKGGKFKNVDDLQMITKITREDLEKALQPYQDALDAKAFEAQRKPVPEPAAAGKSGGKRPGGARAPAEAGNAGAEGSNQNGSGEGPIALVRPGFYGKLPGYENLDKIDPILKTEFLETVNREMCSCGCKNETVAFCLVNDPGCPVVKARARKIYDDIVNKPR
ncbi:MAG TPA: helix-hairpin-helix domain-containing protein [Candidatus Polarisedimenticolia bacterium]|jgi:hypothetical protein